MPKLQSSLCDEVVGAAVNPGLERPG